MHIMTDNQLAKKLKAEGRFYANEEEQEMRKRRDEIIEIIVSIISAIVATVGTVLVATK